MPGRSSLTGLHFLFVVNAFPALPCRAILSASLTGRWAGGSSTSGKQCPFRSGAVVHPYPHNNIGPYVTTAINVRRRPVPNATCGIHDTIDPMPSSCGCSVVFNGTRPVRYLRGLFATVRRYRNMRSGRISRAITAPDLVIPSERNGSVPEGQNDNSPARKCRDTSAKSKPESRRDGPIFIPYRHTVCTSGRRRAHALRRPTPPDVRFRIRRFS